MDEIRTSFPNCGYQMMDGHLHQRGILKVLSYDGGHIGESTHLRHCGISMETTNWYHTEISVEIVPLN